MLVNNYLRRGTEKSLEMPDALFSINKSPHLIESRELICNCSNLFRLVLGSLLFLSSNIVLNSSKVHEKAIKYSYFYLRYCFLFYYFLQYITLVI